MATSMTILLSFCLFFLLLLFLIKQRRKAATSKLPPGPRKLPIIGNLHQLGPMPHHSLHNLSLVHGPLMFLKLGSVPTLVISSAATAREVFKSHDLAFSGRPPLCAARRLSYGLLDVAFAPYGEYWRQARRVCVVELLSMTRVPSFRRVREGEVALLIASVKKSTSSSPHPIDLSRLMLSLSNNIVCRIAFGDKHGGGDYDEGESRFHRILGETQKLLAEFCVGDFFPWLEWVHGFTGLRRRLERNFEELDELYDRVIREHRALGCKEKERSSEAEDLVHVLLQLHEDPAHGKTFTSMDHIKGILTDMFIAGTDTSAATIVWTMTEVMRNPRVMTKLQLELKQVAGNKGKVEENDLPQLEYLKLVVQEALRLHPPAPLLIPRETIEICRFKEYTIPTKTRVFINAKAIAMDPNSWKNPTEFWPERFLDAERDNKGQDFDFIPFGVGRRGCPGMNFAMVVVELALANLLHCFKWELPVGMEVEDLDLEEALGITMHKKIPLCLVAKPQVVGEVG